MNELSPFFKLYRQNGLQLTLGITLAFLALAASISLLTLSGWFLSASALAGLSLITAKTFNFFTPGAGVRGFSILRTVVRYFERVVNHDATFKLLARLRVDCYAKLEPLSPNVLFTYRQGDLLNRLVADIDTLDHLYLRLISPFICAVLSSTFVVVLALYCSPFIALSLMAMLFASIIILPPIFYYLGNYSGIAISDSINRLRIRILNYISGNTDLIVNGAEKTYKQAILNEAQHLHTLEEKMANLSGISSAVLTLISGLTLIVILYLTTKAIHTQAITGPVGAMLVLATLASFEGILPLPIAMQVLGKVKRSAARINELTQQKPTVVFPKASLSTTPITVKNAKIDFENLIYQYPNCLDNAFNNLNLHIKAGEKVAITGHTGCGKSTLLNLLTRFDNPTNGNILINGKPIQRFTEAELRSSMAVMPQHVHIFSGTLRDNLLLACPNASDEKLISVLKIVKLLHLGKAANVLLNTWVGEEGIMLSGGEIRRIGIARVLLQDAPIILLDEPSEGLDTVTEKNIFNELAQYFNGRTVLVATHKPAILAYMDKTISWQHLINN